MPGEFGPFVAPGWAGGAQMPGQPDYGGKLVNAWELGNAVKFKKEELEGKLAEFAMRDRYRDIQDSLKEREFQFKMNQAASHEDYLNKVLGIREETERLQNERVHRAFDLQDRKISDISGYDQYLRDAGDSGLNPLNPDYVDTHAAAKELYPMADAKSEDAVHEVNAAARSARTNIETQQKQYLAGVGRDYFFNNTPDAGAFTSPYRSDSGFETEQNDYEKEHKIPAPSMPDVDPNNRVAGKLKQGQTILDENNIPRKLKVDANGNFISTNERIFYTPATATGSRAYYSRIPKDKFEEIQRTLKTYEDKNKMIPPEVAVGTNRKATAIKTYNPEDIKRVPIGMPYDFLDSNGVWHHYPAKGH